VTHKSVIYSSTVSENEFLRPTASIDAIKNAVTKQVRRLCRTITVRQRFIRSILWIRIKQRRGATLTIGRIHCDRMDR